jgi:tripartite-type tricarboxylate transporter receptor subunit TctC
MTRTLLSVFSVPAALLPGRSGASRHPRLSHCVLALALALVPVLGATPSIAQNWPTRPVKFILTLGPGSGSDISARLLADRLTQKWGQPIAIENKPGGDGIVAITSFIAAHDDHVLLYSPSSSFIAHPYQHDKMPYEPAEFVPIARVSNTVIGISVPFDSASKSLKELVEAARAKPGQLNWAGLTGALDIMFEGWLKSIGVDIKKVPYRNPVDAVNDLATGRVQVYEAAYAIVQSQVQAGKIRTLAVTNTARAAAIANIPTVAEAGYPELTMDGLVGLFGPPTMPLALRERLAAEIKAVMDGDAIINDRLTLSAQIPNPGGPVEFAQSIDDQRAVLAKAVKSLGTPEK